MRKPSLITDHLITSWIASRKPCILCFMSPARNHLAGSAPRVHFLLTADRLPKVARITARGERRGIGPWEARVPAVPLAPRLSPRKVARRPRHFLLYNHCHARAPGMQHPNLWTWRHDWFTARPEPSSYAFIHRLSFLSDQIMKRLSQNFTTKMWCQIWFYTQYWDVLALPSRFVIEYHCSKKYMLVACLERIHSLKI